MVAPTLAPVPHFHLRLVPWLIGSAFLAGCGGGGVEAAARPIPNQGASFSWISGGGSGGVYELPANPPAFEEDHRPRTCRPGQPFKPTVIFAVDHEVVHPFNAGESRPLAVLDDWRPIGTDPRRAPPALARADGDPVLLIPKVDRREVGATDPRPATVTGAPTDFRPPSTIGAYRSDEDWWCDPSGQRHLR
jgi:hypothetical protein